MKTQASLIREPMKEYFLVTHPEARPKDDITKDYRKLWEVQMQQWTCQGLKKDLILKNIENKKMENHKRKRNQRNKKKRKILDTKNSSRYVQKLVTKMQLY